MQRWTQPLLVGLTMSQLFLHGMGSQAAAQSAVMLQTDASRCAIFQALSAEVPRDCQRRTRSIAFPTTPEPAPPAGQYHTPVAAATAPAGQYHAAVATATPPAGSYYTAAATATPPERVSPAPAVTVAPPERVYAFATRIQFAYNSAEVTPEAYPLLDNLAEVLKDTLMAHKRIRIEGHTDSVGSDEYNLGLSQRRALAVQRYLQDRHGITAERLPIIGKGETEPYHPEAPTDAMNRRVQFVNISDSGARR